MNGKRATIAMFFVLLLLVVFIYKRWQEPRRHEIFDRSPNHLYYTKHALCRMDCRHISKQDVEEIMDEGVIIISKNERNDGPCPSFALQGETKDKAHLKIVFGQCESETRVITCINLDKDFECHCPGDPAENKNE